MRNTIKSIGAILGGVLASVLVAALVGTLLFGGIVAVAFSSEPVIMQELPSPDGKYVAYVFESNGGATTGFTYHLSILRRGHKPGRFSKGNTFIQEDSPFSVAWVSDRVLWVENSSTLHRQRTQIRGIEVQYRYIKDSR